MALQGPSWLGNAWHCNARQAWEGAASAAPFFLSKTESKMSARASNGGSHTDAEWRAQLRRQFYRCNNPFCMCDLRADGVVVHRDHFVPVTSGGTDDIANIRAMCGPCNLRKGAKAWRVFLAEERLARGLRRRGLPIWRIGSVLLFALGMIKGLVAVPLAIVFIGFLCLAMFGLGWISRLLNAFLGGAGLVPLLTWASRGPRIERVGALLGALLMVLLLTGQDSRINDIGFGAHAKPKHEAGPIAIPRAASLPQKVPWPPKRPWYLDQPFGSRPTG
jgi:hypothetical protein